MIIRVFRIMIKISQRYLFNSFVIYAVPYHVIKLAILFTVVVKKIFTQSLTRYVPFHESRDCVNSVIDIVIDNDWCSELKQNNHFFCAATCQRLSNKT